jgi:hypothetical protein
VRALFRWLTCDVVVAALVKGIEAGDEEAVEEALGGDPLVRLLARRHLRDALEVAYRDAVVRDVRHLLRLAALAAAGRETESSDVEGVAAAFDATLAELALAAARPPPLLAIVSLIVVLLAGAAGAGWWWTRPFDPRATPAGALLGEGLASYQVALHSRSEDRAAIRARLLGDEAAEVLGAEVVAALAALLDEAEALGEHADPERAADEAAAKLDERALTLNRELRERELPFFVDPTVLASRAQVAAMIYSFYVEREIRYRSGDEEIDVLRLWRLDGLNVRKSVLGYTKPTMDGAVVLLDQLEANLVTVVLPALAEGERVELVEEDEPKPWQSALEQKAAAAVRAGLADIAADHAEGSKRVGELLARRRQLIERWMTTLEAQGKRLRPPLRLIPEADYYEDLKVLVASSERFEWDRLHDELSDEIEAFVHLRDRVALSVDRHELQHRLDARRGDSPIPLLLVELLGERNAQHSSPRSLAVRTRDELSAYLATIAMPEGDPELELVMLARFIFGSGGSIYRYAALAVYLALASELGIDLRGFRERRHLSEELFAEVVADVLAKPSADLRDAAVSAYHEIFARDVEQVESRATRDHALWRH